MPFGRIELGGRHHLLSLLEGAKGNRQSMGKLQCHSYIKLSANTLPEFGDFKRRANTARNCGT
jgi:hypothetical protein